jgi:hypothetical protein
MWPGHHAKAGETGRCPVPREGETNATVVANARRLMDAAGI